MSDSIQESGLPEELVVEINKIKHVAHRCKAMRKTSAGVKERCRNYSRYDTELCIVHGGHSKQYQRRAKTLLDGLTLPAVHTFKDALESEGEPCPLCGRGGYITPLKLKAAQLVLDRVGLGPTTKIELSGKITHDVLVSKMTEDEFEVVDAIMQKVMTRVQLEMDEEEKNLNDAD